MSKLQRILSLLVRESVFSAGGKNCFMLRSSTAPFSICNLPVLPVRALLTNAQCYCCNSPWVLKAMKLNTPFLTFIHTHVCYYLHLTLGPSQFFLVFFINFLGFQKFSGLCDIHGPGMQKHIFPFLLTVL